MLLTSSNGDLIELTVAGYEFAQVRKTRSNGSDENWLIISGRVKRGAESWVFADPCLDAWEARALLSWLQGEGEFPKRIEFTEPNLAFEATADSTSQTTVLVTLRGEAAPPAVSDDIRWGEGSKLVLDVSRDSLEAAAAAWEIELSVYPPR